MKLSTHYFSPFFFIRAFRSACLSRMVTEKHIFLPIRLTNPFLKVKIIRHPTASFVLRGKLRINAYQHGNESVSIILSEKSRLLIDGDFSIGNGTRIYLAEGAFLYIGGKKTESVAGITEKSRIMVRKHVHIGADCVIAWNVFISDCDWHTIDGKPFQEDVFIGDHVWVAGNSTILKGARIAEGSIVGTHSVVMRQSVPERCLVGGNPGKILARDIAWQRDMMKQ